MVLADTGFFLALANRSDVAHPRATAALGALNERLITTWPVLTETTHLLHRRLGMPTMLAFIRSFAAGAFDVYAIPESAGGEIETLMLRHRELPMDLADASLVYLAHQLGHGRILSTDERDFRTCRWKRHEPFENLL